MWRVSNMLAVPTVFSRENRPRTKQAFRAHVWLCVVCQGLFFFQSKVDCWKTREWYMNINYVIKKRATEDKVTLQSHWGLFQATWHGYLCIWRWLGEFWWMFEGVIGCCCSRPACCSHFHSHNMIHLFAKSKHNSLVLFASGVVSGVFFKGEELTDWIEESLANRYWLGWMGGGVFFFFTGKQKKYNLCFYSSPISLFTNYRHGELCCALFTH